MARPLNGIARPGLHTHRSYHGHEENKRESLDGGTPPIPRYEGYEITPRESPLCRNRGRWYGADTKRTPANERALQQFVRDQSSTNYNVLNVLYDRKMQGSKRAHILDIIADKNTANPEWEYQVVFLKLDRNHKKRKSRQKTLSMQIILECKLRPRNNVALPLPRSMSSQGPIRATVGLPTTKHEQESPMLGTVTAPINTPRPQYIPSYVRQRAPSQQNSPPEVQYSDIQNGRGQLFAPPAPRTTNHDSDEPTSLRPASPSSTLSSDTARSSSRGTSYSSSRIDTASIFPRTSTQCAQGCHRNGAQCSYISHSTQTDIKWNASDNSQSTLTQHASTKVREEPKNRVETGNSCVEAPVPCGICGKEGRTSSIDEQSNKRRPPKLGITQKTTVIAFEKPAWMNNMQPVNTPTVISENDDSVTSRVDKSPVNDYHSDKVADAPTEKTLSFPEETNMTLGRGKGHTNSSSHVSRPAPNTTPPIMTPNPSSTNDNAFMRKDITISERLSGLSIATGPPEGYFPPPPLLPGPQSYPRRNSEDVSPPQPKSKSVRFNLSPQVSTVPNTPITGSPPSSPASTSSSSSTESFWTPKSPPKSTHAKPPPQTPRRPSLPRTSHSSTTNARPTNPHLPPPPRSLSYHNPSPPHNHPNITEKDSQSTVPANISRRQSASAQYPTRKPYECKIDRCRSSGFASRDELNLHMSSVHDMEHRGSV